MDVRVALLAIQNSFYVLSTHSFDIKKRIKMTSVNSFNLKDCSLIFHYVLSCVSVWVCLKCPFIYEMVVGSTSFSWPSLEKIVRNLMLIF